MQPLTERIESYVKNSQPFIWIINNFTPNDIYASLDIKSLYPNVLVLEALDQIAVNENLPAHVIELTDHCLKNTYISNLFVGYQRLKA